MYHDLNWANHINIFFLSLENVSRLPKGKALSVTPRVGLGKMKVPPNVEKNGEITEKEVKEKQKPIDKSSTLLVPNTEGKGKY